MDSQNQKKSNISINTDNSTRPQTALIFNQIIKSNQNNSSVEHHLSILNKIRNNSNSNNQSSKLNSSKSLNKSIDIFNDGLNKSDTDSDSDSEENVNLKITEDDLRLEFEKSVNMNKKPIENKLPE